MAIIGDLVATLSLNNTQFNKGIDQSRTRLQKMKRGVGDFRREINLAAKRMAFLGTAAAAAMGVVVNNTLKAQDALGKFAQRLGVSTEALAGLRHAAEQTGVATTSLDMGIQRMTRRIAEAAKGTGEAKDAIKKLGLSAVDLIALSPDQQFRRIAEAMKGVENQSERVRLAFKLFDSEGVALVNTLKLGSEGLDEMQREAEDLGIAITQSQAKSAAAAVDAQDRMQKAFQGSRNLMVTSLAPAITAVADGISINLVNSMKDARKGANNFSIGFGDVIVTTADVVNSAIRTMTFGFQSLGTYLGGRFAAVVQTLKGNFDAAEFIMTELHKDIAQLEKDFLEFDARHFRNQLEKARKEAENLDDTLIGNSITINEYGRSIDKILESFKKSDQLLTKVLKKQKDKREKLAKESAAEMVNIFENAVENIQREFGNTFTEIFRNGTAGFKNFADRIKDIFARLAGEIAASMTMEALGIEGLLRNVSGGGGGAAGGDSGLGQIVNLIGGGGGGLQMINTASLPQRVTGTTLAGANTGAMTGGLMSGLATAGLGGAIAFGANSFFKGIGTLASGGGSTADKGFAALDVIFPGLGSIFAKGFDALGINLSSTDRPDFNIGTRSSPSGLTGAVESPFGFVGGFGIDDLSGGQIKKFSEIIAQIDEMIVQNLTTAEIEAARKAAQTAPTPNAEIRGAGPAAALQFAVKQRFENILKAIGADDASIGSIHQSIQQLVDNIQARVRTVTGPRLELREQILTIQSDLEQQIDPLLNARQMLGNMSTRIGEFLLDLTSAPGSVLSPTRMLKNARQRFQGVLGRAQEGDQQALQNITGVAGNFLDIARRNFASSPEFFKEFSFVQDSLQGVQGQLTSRQEAITETLSSLGVSMVEGNQQRFEQIDTLIQETRELKELQGELNDKLERMLA